MQRPDAPSRRSILTSTIVLAGTSAAGRAGPRLAPSPRAPTDPYSRYPSTDPALVADFVGASHGRAGDVEKMLADHPAIVNATTDWGFGDWETALGAASHVGNRDIALMLMDAGARPDHFTAAMMGWTPALRAMIESRPGLQRTRGPHGITLLAHARAANDEASEIVRYLLSLGNADVPYPRTPLADADRDAILGAYETTDAEPIVLTVSLDNSGTPAIASPSSSRRRLVCVGGRAFHPVGAPAVRIEFAASTPAASLRIIDGPRTRSAVRAIA